MYFPTEMFFLFHFINHVCIEMKKSEEQEVQQKQGVRVMAEVSEGSGLNISPKY